MVASYPEASHQFVIAPTLNRRGNDIRINQLRITFSLMRMSRQLGNI